MITLRDIAAADRNALLEYRSRLIVDKMKLDRFFSVFLEQYAMEEDNLDTPEWFTYREMLKHYDYINRLSKTTEYRIQHA